MNHAVKENPRSGEKGKSKLPLNNVFVKELAMMQEGFEPIDNLDYREEFEFLKKALSFKNGALDKSKFKQFCLTYNVALPPGYVLDKDIREDHIKLRRCGMIIVR